jgi:hypothetical protein
VYSLNQEVLEDGEAPKNLGEIHATLRCDPVASTLRQVAFSPTSPNFGKPFREEKVPLVSIVLLQDLILAFMLNGELENFD